MRDRRFIIGAVVAVLVVAAVVVGIVANARVERVGEPFSLSVNTDPPAGGPCASFKYRSAPWVLDLLRTGSDMAEGSFFVTGTSAAGFAASAPPEVAHDASAFASAVAAWPTNHASVSPPDVTTSAEGIERWYIASCDLSERITGT